MMDKELFAQPLEHWAKLFREEVLSDEFAQDIAHVLEDKAHDLRLEEEA